MHYVTFLFYGARGRCADEIWTRNIMLDNLLLLSSYEVGAVPLVT